MLGTEGDWKTGQLAYRAVHGFVPRVVYLRATIITRVPALFTEGESYLMTSFSPLNRVAYPSAENVEHKLTISS